VRKNELNRTTQKLVKKTITAEVCFRLRTGQDLSLAEIAKVVRNRYRGVDKVEDLRLAFRQAAEEALQRKFRS
jgi:hypothetical protein